MLFAVRPHPPPKKKEKDGGGNNLQPTYESSLYRSYPRYFLGTRWHILERTQNGPLSPILALEIYYITSVQIIWMSLLKMLL